MRRSCGRRLWRRGHYANLVKYGIFCPLSARNVKISLNLAARLRTFSVPIIHIFFFTVLLPFSLVITSMPTAKEKRRRVDTHEKRDETVSAHLECYTQESSCLINSYSPAKGFASELRQIFGTSLLTPQRGIHPAEIPDLSHARFIPTCVGNTPIMDQTADPATVHPHVRGEYNKCTWYG